MASTVPSHPLRIRNVLPADRIKEYHSEFGAPFFSSDGYAVPSEDFYSSANEFKRKYNLEKRDAELLGYCVVNHFCSLFYHNGILDWQSYRLFWEAICRNHHLAVLKDTDRKRPSDNMLPGWTQYHHTKAIHDAVLVSAYSSIDDLVRWYEFSMKCSVHPLLTGDIYQRLVARYLRGQRNDYDLTLDSHCHHEADFFVTLRKRGWRNWLPEATCGFRIIPPVAIIENLQGGVVAKDLPKIGWRWLLVKATECLLKDLGVNLVLFRPAANHWYKKQAGEEHLRRIMDQTAQALRYQPYLDGEGEILVYAKYLDSDEPLDRNIFGTPDIKQLLALKPDESDAF
jgi:hypothetical protein